MIATAFLTGPDQKARAIVATAAAVAQRLGEHSVLVTVLARNVATASGELAKLSADFAS